MESYAILASRFNNIVQTLQALRAVVQAPAIFIPDLVVSQATLMRERQFRRVDGIESLKQNMVGDLVKKQRKMHTQVLRTLIPAPFISLKVASMSL